MPLLEIVRAHKTSPVVDLLDVGKKIRRTPIVVGTVRYLLSIGCSFLTLSWHCYLLIMELMYKIDRACTKFGMPMDPFRVADLVGFGVAVATGMQYLESFPDRVYKSLLMAILLEDNRAGEATHKGFYKYDDKRKASPDPEIMKYIEKSRNMAGVTPKPEVLSALFGSDL